MKLITGNQVNIEKWAEFLASNPYSSPFQTVEFYSLINSLENYSAEVFAIEMNSVLQAVCVVTLRKEKGIKGFFSRRTIIYGGPLIVDNENGPKALVLLLKGMDRTLGKKVIYVETRNQEDYSEFRNSYRSEKWIYVPHLNFRIALGGRSIEELLGAMKYNRRREIQLSIKAGAVYGQAENIEDVRKVYSILRDLYKTKVRLPLPAIDFFEKLYTSSIGKVFIVKYNSQIIGGAFCFFYPQISINTLYYCGLTKIDKSVFPTHLAILSAIEFGVNNKLQRVDLMGAGKPDEKYGVRKYKSEFGGRLEEHGRFLKVYNPLLYHIGKTGLYLLRKAI